MEKRQNFNLVYQHQYSQPLPHHHQRQVETNPVITLLQLKDCKSYNQDKWQKQRNFKREMLHVARLAKARALKVGYAEANRT